MKFEQMNLIRPILRAIREVGYTDPTPIQEKTIPPVLRGRDVLGCAQTGTGKTAAFALPILQRIARDEALDENSARPIRALILTPTRELALQIHENFTQYGKYLPLRCAVIFGGVNQNPQVDQLRAGVDILVATPGRLNDLIGQGHISLRDIRIFVLDEADRMLDMGFIHDVKKVMAKLPAVRQTLLFSATMPPQVEEIAAQLLTDPIDVKISPVTSTVDSVEQSVYYLAKQDKTDLLLYLLGGHGVSNALVFTRTKHGADAVTRKLNKNGVKAMAIHGDKSQNARVTALNRFKSGEIDVLVATDIAARGIDIVELPTVINYNVPEEPETYIHRIGRTGRAGMEGVAITFCCSDELESFRDIEKLIRKTVTERQCEWSVADMQPTKPEPRQQNPRQSRESKQAEAQTHRKSQEKKPKTSEVREEKAAPTRENHKNSKQGQKKQTPPAARKNEPKKHPQKQAEKQTEKQNEKQTEKQTEKHPQKQSAQGQGGKAGKSGNKPAVKPSEPKPAAKAPAKTEKMPSAQKPAAEKQPNKSAPPRRAQPERERLKSAEQNTSRRYADNGEHDGATGQQIVTNFNRSVWLEFNEPPKRAQKPWLMTAEQTPTKAQERKSVEAQESKAPQSDTQEKHKSGRGGVFSRLRRGKRKDRS